MPLPLPIQSAITPSRIGWIATMYPGVRPNICFASFPTLSTFPVLLFRATMEGSSTTIPLPVANTKVFAVPRSIARSDENMRKSERLVMYSYESIRLG